MLHVPFIHGNAPTVKVCTVGALCCVVELLAGRGGRAGEDVSDSFKKADDDVTEAGEKVGGGGGQSGDDVSHGKEPFGGA